MKIYPLIFCLMTANTAFAGEDQFADGIDLKGYIQIRGMTDFKNDTGFALRRLKLWIKPKPGFSKHWYYKVQTTFSSLSQEKFFLQDVKIGYENKLFSFDVGQFVPQYSLQRFQSDYKMAPLERSKVVNTLIPDGKLGVRDIGFQINFTTENKIFKTHLGIFNGYGIQEYRFDNKGYMITHKSEFNFHFKHNKFKAGYSFMFRHAENMELLSILPDNVEFSGKDIRYNVFAMFKNKNFQLQAEYLNADLEGKKACGYYVLSSMNFYKNQIVMSFEDYNDLIPETSDKPYCRIGYNYFIKKYKIRLSFDNYFRMDKNHIDEYYAALQLQLFL